jgi:hypothetical protein
MTETIGTALDPRFRPTSAGLATVRLRQHDFYLVPQTETASLRQSSFVEEEFSKHEKKWKRETQFFSSPADIYLHPSYARIIGMGMPAVSLILRGMRDENADWFYALRAITGANPVTAEMAGDIVKMSDAWMRWGERQGLLFDDGAKAKAPEKIKRISKVGKKRPSHHKRSGRSL